jgi:hypothetical protein
VAVLAAALTVALPGDRRDPAAGPAVLAGRQPEVDAGPHVLDALGVVLQPAGVQEHAGPGAAPPFGGLLDPAGRHTGHTLGPRRRVVAHRGGRLLEAGRVVPDEVVVEPVALDEHVQHGAQQR